MDRKSFAKAREEVFYTKNSVATQNNTAFFRFLNPKFDQKIWKISVKKFKWIFKKSRALSFLKTKNFGRIKIFMKENRIFS